MPIRTIYELGTVAFTEQEWKTALGINPNWLISSVVLSADGSSVLTVTGQRQTSQTPLLAEADTG